MCVVDHRSYNSWSVQADSRCITPVRLEIQKGDVESAFVAFCVMAHTSVRPAVQDLEFIISFHS